MKRKVNQGLTRNNGQCGFTLIESMIAICVFSIGILAIASLQAKAIQGNAESMRLTEATMWAVNQSEQFMALAYDNTELTEGLHGPVLAEDPAYSVTWEVTEFFGNTKDVQITVEWQSNNLRHGLTVNCLKADL